MAYLTYETARRETALRVIRSTFVSGQGAPLVFLWVAGAGLFTLAWNLPHYAALWSVASLAFAGLTARDAVRNPKLQATASRELLEARYPTDGIAQSGHRDAIRKGIDVFQEVLTKLAEMARSHGLEEDELATISEMDRLLALQCESARQIEELQRVLRLIGAEQRLGIAGVAGLRHENIAAVQREIAEASSLIDLIGERMETILLQVYRAETGTLDMVGRAETRQRSAEALDKLQQLVDARREAAKQLIQLVAPDSGNDLNDLETYAEKQFAAMTSATPASDADDAEIVPEPNGNGAFHPAEVDDDLVKPVEDALRKLNDLGALATCVLMDRLPHAIAAKSRLGSNGGAAPATPLEQARILREILADAIERLKPAHDASSTAGRPDALQHAILSEEYLQGISTRSISHRHSIAETTLHRHRRRATVTIARELRRQEELLSHSGGPYPLPISRN